MPSFDDLGLRPELLQALEDGEITQPTALQEAVIPALRRGGNLVARASSGAGKTLAYTLGVLDRLAPREPEAEPVEVPLRLLVLVPTQEEADRVAHGIFPFAQAAGFGVTIPGGTWGTPAGHTEILVAPVAEVMEAVRGSTLKLEGVEAVVVDGASTIAQLGEWERVDTLLDLIPRDTQRVVISAAFPGEVEDLIDRRVKRALRYPAEAALPEERNTPLEGRIGYVLVPGTNKLDVLARQLAQPADGERAAPPVIFCRSDERAADLAEQLAIRGFVVGAADDVEADVAVATSDTTREELMEEGGGELGQTISFDVPADARTLQARHGGDADAVVMVEARELPHVKEVASQARLRAVALPLPLDRAVANAELRAFREEIRRAVREEDLTAQLLVLEPLLEELSAAEVAAALAAMVRRRTPAAPAAAPAAQTPQARASDPGPAPASWARLYVGIGTRDEARAGDLVGALAGEAGIPGSKIGKIELRDTFSIVEVQTDVADRVIQAVNGTTIKGRSVRVDYDRSADRARKQPSRPDPRRRMVRRPPQE